MIQFLLNEQLIQVVNERADLSLLSFLREQKGLTGTKEGCASGDCGACTVVNAFVRQSDVLNDGSTHTELGYQAINSCVTFLSALHGKHVITVEHLTKDKALHPVQQAMVDANATQCGFCTPGFVMSIFALYQNQVLNKKAGVIDKVVDKPQVINALSGNLCRCTGYQPIIKAALNACNTTTIDKEDALSHQQLIVERLQKVETSPHSSTQHSLLPKSREQLAHYINAFPEALLVAGSTDLALLHTQQFQKLDTLISLRYLPELNNIQTKNGVLHIGAASTLSDIEPHLLTHFPSLSEVLTRFASVPIRNQATLGGNIANASPIGDMPPVLLALDANIVLDNGEATRTIALKEFFVDYKKTTLAKGEWINSIQIPLLDTHTPSQTNSSQQTIVKVYKISKRMEDDISAVCMALALTITDGKVSALRTGFGGVAAIPKGCPQLEQTIIGKVWQEQTNVAIGQQILCDSFTPLDDVRASAAYRSKMLQNLWHRFWLETTHEQHKIATRVVTHA